jgi:hypothetical protein
MCLINIQHGHAQTTDASEGWMAIIIGDGPKLAHLLAERILKQMIFIGKIHSSRFRQRIYKEAR